MWKVCGWCWISLSLCSMLWRRSSMKENVLSSSMINWGVDSIQWYAYWMLKWLIDHIQVRRHVEGMGSEEDSVLRWWWHSNIRLMTMTHNYHHIPINRQPCIEICSIPLSYLIFRIASLMLTRSHSPLPLFAGRATQNSGNLRTILLASRA